MGESHCYIWGSCHVKLFRWFLPFKTTVEWSSSDTVVAEAVRKEVYERLENIGWDEEDLDEEDFDLNNIFNDWSKEDSFAIIAGILSRADIYDDDFYVDDDDVYLPFPLFAQVERSSLDSELILRLDVGQYSSHPIFPITAEGLMVGF